MAMTATQMAVIFLFFFLASSTRAVRTDIRGMANKLGAKAQTGEQQVCNVQETAGHVHYGVSFSYQKVGGGCDALRCQPYFFMSELIDDEERAGAKSAGDNSKNNFVRSVTDAEAGLCKCYAGSFLGKSDESSSNSYWDESVARWRDPKTKQFTKAPVAKTATSGDTLLFDYYLSSREPEDAVCSAKNCWYKYTSAMYQGKRAQVPNLSPNHILSRPDHWDIGCKDISAAAPNTGLPSLGTFVHVLKHGDKEQRRAAKNIARMVNVEKELDKEDADLGHAISLASPVQAVAIIEDPVVLPDAATVVDEVLASLPKKKRPSEEDKVALVEEVERSLAKEAALENMASSVTVDIIEADKMTAGTAQTVLMPVELLRGRTTCSANTQGTPGIPAAYTCGVIRSKEDCEWAAELLAYEKSEFHEFNKPQPKYPGYCSVRYEKSGTKHVWWNDSPDEKYPKKLPKNGGRSNVGWGLICGCYKDVQASQPLPPPAETDTADVSPELLTSASSTDLEELNTLFPTADISQPSQPVTPSSDSGGDVPGTSTSGVVSEVVAAIDDDTFKPMVLSSGPVKCSTHAQEKESDPAYECGVIETKEDCQYAAGLLDQKSAFHSYGGAVLAYAGYCSVRQQKDGTAHVWWNPSTIEKYPRKLPKNGGGRNVGWSLLCGCYKKDEHVTPVIDAPVIAALDMKVSGDPVIVAEADELVADLIEETENPVIVAEADELVADLIEETESLDLSMAVVEVVEAASEDSLIANCKGKADEAMRAECFCFLFSKSFNEETCNGLREKQCNKLRGDECTRLSNIAQEFAAPWACEWKKVSISKKKRKNTCAATWYNGLRLPRRY